MDSVQVKFIIKFNDMDVLSDNIKSLEYKDNIKSIYKYYYNKELLNSEIPNPDDTITVDKIKIISEYVEKYTKTKSLPYSLKCINTTTGFGDDKWFFGFDIEPKEGLIIDRQELEVEMSKIINKCLAMADTYNHYCIFALRMDSKKYKLTGTLSEYQTINDVTFDGNASTSFRVAFKQLELLMGYIVIDENGYVYGTKIPFIKVPCTSFGFMNIKEFQYKRMFNSN